MKFSHKMPTPVTVMVDGRTITVQKFPEGRAEGIDVVSEVEILGDIGHGPDDQFENVPELNYDS